MTQIAGLVNSTFYAAGQQSIIQIKTSAPTCSQLFETGQICTRFSHISLTDGYTISGTGYKAESYTGSESVHILTMRGDTMKKHSDTDRYGDGDVPEVDYKPYSSRSSGFMSSGQNGKGNKNNHFEPHPQAGGENHTGKNREDFQDFCGNNSNPFQTGLIRFLPVFLQTVPADAYRRCW